MSFLATSTCKYHDKGHNDVSNYGNVKIYLQSHFSNDSDQNAATTFEHMKNFIHRIYKNILVLKDSSMYDTIYGVRK